MGPKKSRALLAIHSEATDVFERITNVPSILAVTNAMPVVECYTELICEHTLVRW